MININYRELVNDNICDLRPYEPGKPIEEVEREFGVRNPVKLASNENPLPPSKRIIKYIKDALKNLNRYPDGSGYYLRKALALKLNTSMDNLMLGNGSNEIIEIVVRTFIKPGDEVIIPDPSFVVYPMIVQASGGRKIIVQLKDFRIDLDGIINSITGRTKIIFIANPNNPTGTIVRKKEVEIFLKSLPKNIIVVFDEAYYEFANSKDYPDTINYLDDHNLLILRTFSKISSLAGLRIGYCIGNHQMIEYMNRIRQPFNTNSLAQIAALASLEDDNYIKKTLKLIKKEKLFLYKSMDSLGISYIPSNANFILVDVGDDSNKLHNFFMQNGVIIRPMASFGLKNFIRVTIGLHEENEKFIRALESAVKQ